jgi:hypothetical protein
VIADEEERAAQWRVDQRAILRGRLAALRALSAPLAPYVAVREAWRPIELAIAEAETDLPSAEETLEENPGRRNPFGCLIP